jgi:hypothetical protein
MARVNRTPDDAMRAWLFGGLFLLVLGGWIAGFFLYYQMPKSMVIKGLWYGILQTPHVPLLWIGPAVGLLLGVFVFIYGVVRWTTKFGGAEFLRHLRGPRMINQYGLTSKTKSVGRQLRFMYTPVPKEVESTHFLVGGSTGTGKSQCIAEFAESAQERGDRLICIDPDGGFMRNFYNPGDKILNPFDARGQGWSIFNEIRSSFDCEQYAISMIPRSPSTEQESWNSMARTIVSETLHVLIKINERSTDRLVYWLTSASNTDLQRILKGTPAEGCFHGADETLASIRVVLTQYVTPHKYLSAGTFSFRDFLENNEGNLWVTWRQDQLQALKPLISCWTDVVCAAVLSMPEDRDRGLHLICDELDSLEKLNYLVDAATKGRKKGFRILAGIQSLAQLRRTYGDDDALTLRNSFRSVALFGVAEMDTYTAEEFSKGLGEHTVIRRNDSVSMGGQGGSRGTSGTRQDTERVVSPAEIHLLPNLTGYLKFAGNYPIAKVRMQYKARNEVIEPMVMAEEYSKPIGATADIFAVH